MPTACAKAKPASAKKAASRPSSAARSAVSAAAAKALGAKAPRKSTKQKGGSSADQRAAANVVMAALNVFLHVIPGGNAITITLNNDTPVAEGINGLPQNALATLAHLELYMKMKYTELIAAGSDYAGTFFVRSTPPNDETNDENDVQYMLNPEPVVGKILTGYTNNVIAARQEAVAAARAAAGAGADDGAGAGAQVARGP